MENRNRFFQLAGLLVLALVCVYLKGGDQPLEAAVWIAPILLLRFFREVKWWVGLLVTLPLLTAVTMLADNGMTPIPVTIVIVLTLIRMLLGLIPYLLDRVLRESLPRSLRTLLFATAAVAVEAYLASEFTGGTWFNPAYGIGNLPLLQVTSVLGIWGLLFLVYWTAAVLNELWEQRREFGRVRRLSIVWLAVILAVHGFGIVRLHRAVPAATSMRVAGLTPGPEYRDEMMGIFRKIYTDSRQGVFDPDSLRPAVTAHFRTLLAESQTLAAGGSELVAWSEGATFLFSSDEEASVNEAKRAAAESGAYLALGIVVLEDSCQSLLAAEQPFVTNKVILISPEGETVWQSAKYHRAPGFERMMTIKGDSLLPRGAIPQGIITGAVCYDMDFPAYIRQAGRMESGLIMAPSNDWPEIIHTHAAMARMRAIENGTSLLRPTSSGISLAADAYGRIRAWVDAGESGGAPLTAVLPVHSLRALYTVLGDVWMRVCGIGSVLFVLFAVTKRLQRKKRKHIKDKG
ncbi:hypothetical protein JXO52_13620 [bacterium]|nr:hypothetical protein [bacterium]